jgi:cobalt/nickel transport system permease protein
MRHPGMLSSVLAVILFLPLEQALAMHISEGILQASWVILWFALVIPFVALGLRELGIRNERDPRFKPMVGLVGAAVFLISCMPIPVPIVGTCSHPCGTGMAAVLVGPSVTVVMASVALLLQALFLAHGGLTSLGANVLTMGVVGAFLGYGAFLLARRTGLSWPAAAFLAGLISDWATYAATSMVLAFALHGQVSFLDMFLTISLAFIPTQVPLGVLEGFMAAGAISFVKTRRPELLALLARGGAP